MACKCSNPARNSGGYGCRSALTRSSQTERTYGGCLIPRPCSPYYGGPAGPVNPVPGCYRPCAPGVPSCWSYGRQCYCSDYPYYPEPANPDDPTPVPVSDLFDPAYGFFFQNAVLTLAAGGIVPFNGANPEAERITMAGGVITVLDAGVYEIDYTVNIPPVTAVGTTFSLSENGLTIPGTSIVVTDTVAHTSSMHLSGHTIVPLIAGATLRLVSSGELDITAADGNTLASLSIIRVA